MTDHGTVRALDRDIESHRKFADDRLAGPGAATAEQHDAALAALTGTVTEQRPDTELARNMLRLRLVMQAKHQGIPWTAIGAALGGISGKAAKAEMKALARVTQRQLLASQRKG